MSSNKTLIQGLEPSGAQNSFNQPTDSFYSRNATPDLHGGTVVPGMDQSQSLKRVQEGAPEQTPLSPVGKMPVGKPILGFLYSVSRTGMGEYWPLYQGENTIGNDPNCNICLGEATVSSTHASIVLRKMKSGKVIASVCDSRSTNGSMLNGEELDFNPHDCKNGDILTVGENYQLLLIIIDVVSLGLAPVASFHPIEIEPAGEDTENPSQNINGGMPPAFDPNMYNVGGTVGFDGNFDGNNRGGTIGM